jgi:hypothetical protein
MAVTSRDGFIIILFGGIVRLLHTLSAVEWLKSGALAIARWRGQASTAEAKRTIANLAIDVFVVAKWAFLVTAFACGLTSSIVFLLTGYLLFFNLFSYFYYHAWGSQFPSHQLSEDALHKRDQRRLLSFLLAIAYSFLGFAYLYAFQFASHFQWPPEAGRTDALLLSICNSFTLTYGGYQPLDPLSRSLLVAQVLNMFVFITILVANSIPNLSRER